MNIFSKATEKYLQLYAEVEIQYVKTIFEKLFLKKDQSFQYCLCIPVFNEDEIVIKSWVDLAIKNDALLIIVLNQPADSLSKKNDIFAKAINYLDSKPTHNKNCSLYSLSSTSSLLLVDKFTQGNQIPASQGVGYARKIAADIALQLITNNYITSRYIHCSDADVRFPSDYFSAAMTDKTNSSNISAILYPYSHQYQKKETPNSELETVTQLYELHLQHYVNGLDKAGSMYAYHSLGSIMCISAYHYAAVRGFPKRSAGEDFYLLNKLRKLDNIITLNNPSLIITPRISERTPFGTGVAVSNLITQENYYEAKFFYHPDLFILLKYGLIWLKNLADDCFTTDKKTIQLKQLEWRLHLKQCLNKMLDADELIIKEILLTHRVLYGFDALGFDNIFRHCQQQCNNAAAFHKQLNYWFDGFRTLKWLHLLRAKDTTLANISYRTLQKINHSADKHYF